MKLVLCSASPRRREFLERIGVGFSLAPAHIDETRGPGEAAVAYALRMAREKAGSCARPGQVVLAADTIGVVGVGVLGKPRDRSDGGRMVRMPWGVRQRRVTGV